MGGIMANLIVCCDGTWNTADQQDGGIPTPTNVVRLFNLVAERDKDGVEQKKYYHPGVGTDGGPVSRVLGGGIGIGLDRNIKSGYRWLCSNYSARDLIFLFGFSRGAYTARSLGGMTTRFGLLDPAGLTEAEIWKRIDDVFDNGYRVKGTKRQSFVDKGYKFKSGDAGLDVPVHFIGVWDTVGALGIPDHLGLLNLIDDPSKHQFHDTELNPLVRHARHALALDEMRASFEPTLWTNVKGRDVKQIWFPGAHSDVGGGYREIGLANGSLIWMLAEAKEQRLAVNPDVEAQIKADCRDLLHDSLTDIFKLLPSKPRAVPAVDSADPQFLHASVTERCKIPPVTQMPYRPTKRLKKGESATFPIYAIMPWNPTGLFMEQGATYKLEATGEWLDSNVACSPEGTDDGKFQPGEIGQVIGGLIGQAESLFRQATGSKAADFWLTKRHEDFPWFCLVGVIADGKTDESGHVTHEVLKIGKGLANVAVARGGYLYGYANDAWNFYTNNRGSVQLTVTRL
jgi:hypothetical protein